MILPISPLGQRDSRWASQRLGTVDSTTLGSHGCVVTSMCMLATYYSHPILPNQLDDILTDRNYYYDGNLFVNDSITRIFSDVKFDKVTFCETVPAPIDEIKRYLDEGKPVVVALINQGIRHYVLAVGYKYNQIIVNDPWRGDQVNINDRWGDSASKILQVNFFSGPVPKKGSVVEEVPTTSILTVTDQTRLDLGVTLGVMEVQAIRSEILDLRRDKNNLQNDLTNANNRIIQLQQQPQITDQTKIFLGTQLGYMEVQAIRSEILDLRTIRNNLEREIELLRKQVLALQKVENLPVTESRRDDAVMLEPIPNGSSPLKSRKLWLSISGALVAFLNSALGLGITQDQMMTILGPLVAYVGVEGLADAVERYRLPQD